MTTVSTVNLAKIPAQMRSAPRWACHRKKIPHQPNGQPAKSNDPTTWSPLDNVVAVMSDFDGIGFMLGDGFAAIDIDHCVMDGVLHPEAQRIIKAACSYSELSLSRTGVHIVALGKLPTGRRVKNPPPLKVELYDSDRFLIVTGNHIAGTPSSLEERTLQLVHLHAELFPAAHPQHRPAPQPIDASDSDLLEKAFNSARGASIRALFNGDTIAYGGDDSSADLALCDHLGFWLGGDADRVDRVFRSSRLMRDKWDEKRGAMTYGERTIRKALDGMTEFYKPPRVNGSNGSNGHHQSTESIAMPAIVETPEPFIPELPKDVVLDESEGADACPWLDAYIDFSRRWAPRGFDGFHEAVALFILSTVAARRVTFPLGKSRYTNLYISLVSRSSLYTKSTVAEVGISVLRSAGADFLLAPDESTPQRFIMELTPYLPDDFDQWTPERKERHELRLALPGQRGWFYEEFGQHLDAMMRKDGVMADFRGMLKRFDDCPDRYESATIKRGAEVVERPYLALLANMTPANLGHIAKRGSTLWSDGYLARFAFVTPRELNSSTARFPIGQREDDPAFGQLVSELAAFHHRLGVPPATIEEERNAEGGFIRRYAVAPKIEPTPCVCSDDVIDAFYAYHNALAHIALKASNDDLDANYNRLAEKALRVAMLLAAFSTGGRMTLSHWARAQAIAERWREGLHALFEQVNQGPLSAQAQREEKLLLHIQHLKNPTAREIQQRMKGISAAELEEILRSLEHNGTVERLKEGKTFRFYLTNNVESVATVDM